MMMGRKPSTRLVPLVNRLVIFVLIAVLPSPSSAGGGNCENVCLAAMDPHYITCVNVPACTKAKVQCADEGNACTCGAGCQECFEDIYGACGGCTNNFGFDFDKTIAPNIKSTAEMMGCSAAAINSSGVGVFLVVVTAALAPLLV